MGQSRPSEPLRILVVQDTDWIERGPHQQHHVFERLAARGHVVKVVDFPFRHGAPRSHNPMDAKPRTTSGPAVELHGAVPLRAPILDKASFGHRVRKVVRTVAATFHPDVVVGHGILADRAARLELPQIPYVAHWLDALDQLVHPAAARPLARRILRKNLRVARRAIAINRRLAEYMVRRGAPGDQTTVIPAGIDLVRYGSDAARKQTRERFGIAAQDFVAFFMGWLYPFSGVDRVARAIHRLPASTRLHLVVAGEGDLLADLQGLARQDPRIHVLGRRPFEEVPALLSAADAGLVPAEVNATMRDIVPIKVYEYLAAGRSVYSTPLPGVQTEFPSTTAIRYVESAEKIVEVLANEAPDPATTTDRANAIRASVQGRDWDDVTARFEAVLREAIA